MSQIRLVEITRHGIGVINLWSVDFLKCFHGADRADKLKVGVIRE